MKRLDNHPTFNVGDVIDHPKLGGRTTIVDMETGEVPVSYTNAGPNAYTTVVTRIEVEDGTMFDVAEIL